MNAMLRLIAWFKNINSRPHLDWKQELINSKVAVLQQSIKDAFRFLRTTHLRSFFYRHKLPWYLVFGAENTGKTSLLMMSGLNLVSTDNQPLQQIIPTTHCHWFFGKEAIFVDVSGRLMLSDVSEDHSLHLWKKFVDLLYRHRHYRPVDGLIVCIDLLDFQNKDFEQRRLHVDILQHHIQTFKHHLPVHLMFTRCDRMQGFTDFFQMLSTEERQQACGISLPNIDQQNFPQQLETQINAFLQRINQQIIMRLQRERSPEKRILIKNFPLQLEALKHTIIQLASQLHSTKNSIQGIYFTSSQQEGVQSDALATLLDTFGFPTHTGNNQSPLQKNAYFIQNALKRVIATKHNLERKIPLLSLWDSPKFYPILASIILLAMVVMVPSYFANKRAISHVTALISEYQNVATGNTGKNTLSLLNTLRTGLDEITKASNPLTSTTFHRANDLKIQLNSLYQQALLMQFGPELQHGLEAQLQADIDNKSPRLFNTLKMYLMLANSTHVDKNFITAWFNTYAEQTYPDNRENQQAFLLHLEALLSNKAFKFNTDSPLVNAARDNLNGLAPVELAYTILQDKYPLKAKTAAINTPLYNALNFDVIINQTIPKLAVQITQQDAWVLDASLPIELSGSVSKQLTTDLQQLYKDRYLDFWETQLANINVPTFRDIHEAQTFAASLNTHRSLLLQPLNTIQTNLKPLAGLNDTAKLITALEQTRQLLTNSQPNNAATKALNNLNTYLTVIATASNSEQATLIATADRMRGNGKDPISQLIIAAKTAPAPLNHLLNALALNTWEVMLQTSEDHLNVLWATEVLPKYNVYILNRYPIFKEAKTDTSLSEFSHFFGPDGTMDSFFKRNLAAFVDSSQLYWRWKTLDGMRLEIPQNTLEMFNRAYVIRKMYFGDNQKTPNIKFTLTPTSADLISSNFVLNVNGQMVNYATDFSQARSFTWPGAKPASASLQQDQGENSVALLQESGDWALFKLLSHAEMASSHNPKLYQFEFNVGGKQVVYELLTDNAFNPFIPDITTRFRLPEKL